MLELLLLLAIPRLLPIVAALLPAIVLGRYVYKYDTVEKESPALIARLVVAGVLSALAAALLEGILEPVAGAMFGRKGTMYFAVLSFCVVGFAEELCKLVLLRVNTWNSKEFNYTFDAVIYGAMVSLGFAAFENIFYVLQGGLGTAIARAILSVPGHLSWGILMGVFYGQAKVCSRAGDKAGETRSMIFALVVPMMLHGFYDLCAFTQSDGLSMMLLAFAAGVDLLAVSEIKRGSKGDAPMGPKDEGPRGL